MHTVKDLSKWMQKEIARRRTQIKNKRKQMSKIGVPVVIDETFKGLFTVSQVAGREPNGFALTNEQLAELKRDYYNAGRCIKPDMPDNTPDTHYRWCDFEAYEQFNEATKPKGGSDEN